MCLSTFLAFPSFSVRCQHCCCRVKSQGLSFWQGISSYPVLIRDSLGQRLPVHPFTYSASQPGPVKMLPSPLQYHSFPDPLHKFSPNKSINNAPRLTSITSRLVKLLILKLKKIHTNTQAPQGLPNEW